jgi:hypothetical protein
MDERTQGISTGKLAAGLALVAVGIAGVVRAPHELWRYWPVLLIFIGLGQETEALRTRRGGGGFFLMALGVWLLAGSLELFGLDYGSALPLAVIMAGTGMILHTVLGIENKETPRGQQ